VSGTDALVVEDLEVRHRRGPQAAVRGVSLRLPAGGGLAISGPAASGKTSLLKGLLGLVPCAGTVEVLGGPPGLQAIQRRIGYGPEGRPFQPGVRVAELIDALARIRGAPNPRAAAARALELCALGDAAGRPALELGPEENRRAALACAAVALPDLLLLDDAWESPETVAVIEDARARGATVLVASDRPGRLLDYLDNELRLSDGAPA
jgi:ABC-type multidrug transport system ATPase subunit